MRKVLLDKVPRPVDIALDVGYKFLYPGVPFGVAAFYGNLPHNAALTVARRGIGPAIRLAECFIRDDDISRLEACNVECFAGRCKDGEVPAIFFIKGQETCEVMGRIDKIAVDLVAEDDDMVGKAKVS